MTTTLFSACAETVQQLHTSASALEEASKFLALPPLREREWFQSLEQKLVPQLQDNAFLVVAVVGGTNIGKSVIFNHIAGCSASAVSPLASGTKHPVCLTPPGFAEHHDLRGIFREFELVEWSRDEDPLTDCAEDRLFWRTSERTPDNLLILDTPDIDSDAQVNWRRADSIRRAADVLLAVLTQQKYNDAAVKQFFRKAAAEDKAVIVVFNQCQLPDDEPYWPLWLQTFCRETGIKPEFIYVAPNDRRAAEQGTLAFYERRWKSPAATIATTDGAAESTAVTDAVGDENAGEEQTARHHLADDLSRLRFATIKLRTLRGALTQLADADQGVPSYLREIRGRSGELRSAAEWLTSEGVVKIHDWPAMPNTLLVTEIRRWWQLQQQGWSKTVHGFYNAVGQGMLWPLRFARDRLQGPPPQPMETYRKQEWGAMLRTVEEIFDKLTLMSESGNELLKPQFERLLTGSPRAALVEQLHRLHDDVSLNEELAEVIAAEMQAFRNDRPAMYSFYRRLNEFSAAARPVASVVLFSLGWGPAGHAVAPMLVDAATHTVVPIFADFAGGAAAAVAGETAISSAAGTGMGLLQAKFQRLQTSFTTRRARWLAKLLKEHLLGTLPEDLRNAARLPESEPFRALESSLRQLQTRLGEFVAPE